MLLSNYNCIEIDSRDEPFLALLNTDFTAAHLLRSHSANLSESPILEPMAARPPHCRELLGTPTRMGRQTIVAESDCFFERPVVALFWPFPCGGGDSGLGVKDRRSCDCASATQGLCLADERRVSP